MTDAAPKRIWVRWLQPSGTGLAFSCQSRPPELRTEYILASEHAALIREAEARGMERAAEICEVIRTGIANGPMPEGARFDYEQAIRAAKATP